MLICWLEVMTNFTGTCDFLKCKWRTYNSFIAFTCSGSYLAVLGLGRGPRRSRQCSQWWTLGRSDGPAWWGGGPGTCSRYGGWRPAEGSSAGSLYKEVTFTPHRWTFLPTTVWNNWITSIACCSGTPLKLFQHIHSKLMVQLIGTYSWYVGTTLQNKWNMFLTAYRIWMALGNTHIHTRVIA